MVPRGMSKTMELGNKVVVTGNRQVGVFCNGFS